MTVDRQHKPIRRLLIANRGEIARRVIRTAHAMGMQTVAVYSEADALSLHVREATTALPLGGNVSADSYLRIDKILAAAKHTGADAVHPGYGFLSENAVFAQAVIDAGLTWVGPPPEAIHAVGNKASAKRLAQSRGVPCLPGYEGEDQSDARLASEAQRIGFPVMVKAAAGGGGRGMRLVMDAAQLIAAVQSARSEALAAFGSGELLLERALLQPRHVEVQVFADTHGHCIHLGERDCSVQRRHQKLIEETPSPAVDAQLRERMGRCAVELALAAGYVGAGTVEFLVEQAGLSAAGPPQGARAPSGGSAEASASSVGAFFLMEMNTRLQVEHPVTEAVTGLDLAEWQLRVAQGEELPLTQEQVRFSGHAIEVRLCAEDGDFNPHAGRVQRFCEPGDVRFDHALFEGLDVPAYYDSMLGKLVVHAATRDEAIDRLAGALDRTLLLGLPSNRRLLAACLRHPEFRAGRALIPFLSETGDALRAQLRAEDREAVVPAALAALFGAAPQSSGEELACPFPRPLRVSQRGEVLSLRVTGKPDGQLEVDHDGQVSTMARPSSPCVRDGNRWHVQLGAIDLFVDDLSFEPAGADPGGAAALELRAPFNGKVIAVKARAGEAVSKGEILLLLESMKLEHALAASRDGIVKAVHVAPGQQAATSQVLVTFEAAA